MKKISIALLLLASQVSFADCSNLELISFNHSGDNDTSFTTPDGNHFWGACLLKEEKVGNFIDDGSIMSLTLNCYEKGFLWGEKSKTVVISVDKNTATSGVGSHEQDSAGYHDVWYSKIQLRGDVITLSTWGVDDDTKISSFRCVK